MSMFLENKKSNWQFAILSISEKKYFKGHQEASSNKIRKTYKDY